MGLPKGRTNNQKGRPAGTPNKVTRELRVVLRDALGGELSNLPQLLSELEPRDRIQAIIKLLDFVLPKPSPEILEEKKNQANLDRELIADLFKLPKQG